jgi:glycosyltransferase involved in cell wall biosynthesis
MDIVERHSGSLTKVVSEPDMGIYHAMNKGLRLATGDVVGILNADDYYPSDDVLAKVIEAFSNPDVDACYGDLVYVDSKDASKVVRFWRSGDYNSRKFHWGWMPPHPTFFVRRSVYQKYGLFNLELGSAADYEIMLRFLLKHRLKAVYIPQVLVHMRTGGVSNATVANRLKANKMDRKAWSVNGLRPYPCTLWLKPVRKIGQWFVKR